MYSLSLLLLLTPPPTKAAEPWWPFKNRDLNRSGYSPHAAPFDVSKPTWIWSEPRLSEKGGGHMQVFHGSPILDEESNVYIQGTSGWAYSLDKNGHLRWEKQTSGEHPGNFAYSNGVLYSGSTDGIAWALDAKTGDEKWKVKIGLANPADTFSTTVVGDIMLIPVTPENWRPELHKADFAIPNSGAEELVALSIHDGSEKWRYSVANRSGLIMYNVMPAIVGDAVIFTDYSGGLYKLSLKDGKEIWYEPGANPGTWSTGGMAIGPNNKVYVAANYWIFEACNGKGILRAHDIHTGKPLWNRTFLQALNAAPAVGPLKPGGPLAVVVAAGNNLSPAPFPWWLRPLAGLALLWFRPQTPTVAFDAETGDLLWNFELPLWSFVTHGVTSDALCAPDVYGNPTIGADGTVYVNWSGGKLFALRDANGDGKIDANDASEVQSFSHLEGSNSNSAISPGFLVAVSCKKVIGVLA